MTLPDDWVKTIFTRLTVVYGARFVGQWPGLDPKQVMDVWAEELDGITSGGVAHALANLPPDFPPNPMQFRALCNRRPMPVYRALPAPKTRASEEVRAKVARVLNRARRSPKQWALDLKAREEAGDALSPVLSTMWRAALASTVETQASSIGAASSPIDDGIPQTEPQEVRE